MGIMNAPMMLAASSGDDVDFVPAVSLVLEKDFQNALFAIFDVFVVVYITFGLQNVQ